MAGKRAKCEITQDLCELYLKSHVTDASKIDGRCAAMDDEDFTETFVGLLAALAKHSTRVNSKMMEAAAAKVLGLSKNVAAKFGHQVSSAISWNFGKGLKATSGKRLSESSKTVMMSFKDSRLEALHAMLAGEEPEKKHSLRKSTSSMASSELVDEAGRENDDAKARCKGNAQKDVCDISKIADIYGVSPLRSVAGSSTDVFQPDEIITVAESPVRPSGSKPGTKPPAKEEPWFDVNNLSAHRLTDGLQENGVLAAGPSGFCIAHIGGDAIQTEIPNLMIQKHAEGKQKLVKKPAGRPPKKKPAAAEEEDEKEDAENLEEVPRKKPAAASGSEEGEKEDVEDEEDEEDEEGEEGDEEDEEGEGGDEEDEEGEKAGRPLKAKPAASTDQKKIEFLVQAERTRNNWRCRTTNTEPPFSKGFTYGGTTGRTFLEAKRLAETWDPSSEPKAKTCKIV